VNIQVISILDESGSSTMLRIRSIFLLMVFICVFGFADAALADGQYMKVDYPASTVEGELKTAVTYTIWIPDGVKTLRGIIVHQHGAGTTASKEGATAAYDLHWQALARKWDCALLGPSYHVTGDAVDLAPGGSEHWFDVRRGSEKAFLRGLTDLAGLSGHTELTTVPWILWGHSGGGIWANGMAILHPERVVALYLRSGTVTMFHLRHPEFTDIPVPDAVYSIPTMVSPGAKEKPANDVYPGNIATFKDYRAKGGLIGLAIDPRTGHECGDSRYLAIPFLDLCMSIRLPDKGSKNQSLKPMDTRHVWLAQPEGETAVPKAEFKGDLKTSVWLPSEAIAKDWMEYVKTGAVGDTTPPSAPTRVIAASKGDQGTEVTWHAEADFESGIGQFIVLRDGQELARVPEKPVGKFGRPLFQGMTYHDTPDQPLSEMRYLDTSAKAGEKHTYTVITVNSVGLKSNPSIASVKIYNTVKLKLMAGKQVIAGGVSSADLNIYCAMANAGFDLMWIEMQHSPLTFQEISHMIWAGRGSPAIPFVRVPDATEGDIQKAVDLGALGIVVPTVETVEKAQAAVRWAKYPPLGRRSLANGQANALWGDDYRQTANDNIMVVLIIETPTGVEEVEKIAAVPGVDVLYVGSGDLSSFSGKSEGNADYDAMVARIHDITLKAGLKLGGPPSWRNRPGYSFSLGPEEPAFIKMGAKAWLESLPPAH
jgi:2-keto-3-deoxy-L-rhamnonate aldolase RhmA/pimeloyl-ACP methyl ester carboxylesterase